MTPRRPLIRILLCLLALVSTAGRTPTLASGGREYHRCIQACGEAGQRCDDRCDAVCSEMFPGDESRISNCVKACRAECTDQRKECRIFCKIFKGPSSDPEP